MEKSFISEIKDQHILLFDDIITSGNSFMACAQLLLDNGAKNYRCYIRKYQMAIQIKLSVILQALKLLENYGNKKVFQLVNKIGLNSFQGHLWRV